MKSALVLACVSGALSAPTKDSYARWMTESMIAHGVEPDYHYDEATLYTSFEKVIEFTGDESLKDLYRSLVDGVVAANGTILGYDYSHYSLDNYRFGNNALWWYEQTGEERYKAAADSIKATLDKHPRTPTGGFWHRDVVYPNQMWLDGIYMADSFYARWVSMFQPDNQTAWDDVALQFDKIDAVTRKDNNLLVHGFDESKQAIWADPVTGAAPLVWGRAVGWYFMALLEVMELFPKDHPAQERFLGYYTGLAEGLKNAQDERGAWWNVMDEQYEDVEGNYLESSASVMFTYGWLKGINEGLLVDEYLEVARKAYKAMIDLFVTENDDGTLNWEGTVEVGSLGSNATFEVGLTSPVRYMADSDSITQASRRARTTFAAEASS